MNQNLFSYQDFLTLVPAVILISLSLVCIAYEIAINYEIYYNKSVLIVYHKKDAAKRFSLVFPSFNSFIKVVKSFLF
jgi:hypothetical protein